MLAVQEFLLGPDPLQARLEVLDRHIRLLFGNEGEILENFRLKVLKIGCCSPWVFPRNLPCHKRKHRVKVCSTNVDICYGQQWLPCLGCNGQSAVFDLLVHSYGDLVGFLNRWQEINELSLALQFLCEMQIRPFSTSARLDRVSGLGSSPCVMFFRASFEVKPLALAISSCIVSKEMNGSVDLALAGSLNT